MTGEEMSNGSDRQYSDALTAQLGERVTNLGRRQSDLESEMRNGFRQVESSVQSVANETRSALATISQTISERSKPQWQALSVMLAAMVVLGGLLYWPIRETTTDIKTTLMRIDESMVTRSELEARSARGAEDRERTVKDIDNIRQIMLPRAEWSERNQSRDHEIASLQKQIDLQRVDFQAFASSLGNGRDFIIDLKDEVGRLRDQISEMRARQYQKYGAPPISP